MQINFKTFKINKLLYPCLLTFVLLVLSLASFLFIKYLLVVTNRVLVSDSAVLSDNLVKLNLNDYNTVAAKIGLPLTVTNIVASDAESDAVGDEPPKADIDLIATATNSIANINKQDIKMAIYNDTKKIGLAAALQDKLLTVGFANISIGSTTTSTSGAVIGIKESASDFYSEIETEVGKIYSNIIRQTLTEDFAYDVWISIGS